MNWKPALYVSFFLLPDIALGQNPCGFDLLHQKALQNPAFSQRIQQVENEAFHFFKKNQPAADQAAAPVTIPVVVHIVHDNGPENISDAQVQQAIQWLNDAFANAGPYAQGSGADAQIRFCLAQRTPDNLATNGITRDQSTLTEMNADYQDLALKNINRWDPKQYLNIWVVRSICSDLIGCSIAAYAFQPGFHGLGQDGVVIESWLVGSTAGNNVALAHEVGHYFGLYHTFEGGCTNNDCLLNGDRVCDTPPDQSTAAIPCNQTVNTCTTDTQSGFSTDQPDMTWNFMDYGDYACMHDFTPGQVARMQYVLAAVRKSLQASKGCLPPCPGIPVAAFTSSATTIEAGTAVAFTNQSQNYAGLQWTIDGTPFSTAENPAYTFDSVGFFTVTLTLEPIDTLLCAVDTARVVILVLCPARADFSLSNLYPAIFEPVVVTNLSQNATYYEWRLNGQPLDPALDTLIFSEAGTYTLKLTAGNSFCSGTRTRIIQVSDSCRDVSFIRMFRDSAPDGGYGSAFFELADGHYVLAGGLGHYNQAFFMKTNTNGAVLWAKRLDGPHLSSCTGGYSTPDTGFVLALQRDVNNIGVAKIDAQGVVEWAREIAVGMPFTAMLNTVRPDADGGVLLCGALHPVNSAKNGAFVAKLSANGTPLWSRIFRSTEQAATDIRPAKNGGYFAVGYGLQQSAPSYSILYRLDSVGQVLWAKRYQLGNADELFQLLDTPAGNWLLAGRSNNEGWLTKVDNSGAIIWSKRYPGTSGFKTAAATGGGFAFIDEFSMTRVDANGTVLFHRIWDNPPFSSYRINSLHVPIKGGFLCAGVFLGDFGVAPVLVKLDANGLAGDCQHSNANTWEEPYLPSVDDLTVEAFPIQSFGAPVLTTQALVLSDTFLCRPVCDTLALKPEICFNNRDDDYDGLFDCLDPECDCPSDDCHPGAANHWYFGKNASLDFSTEPPTVRAKSTNVNLYGSASIGDPRGRLLFYSDGKTLYNRFHQPMPNGQNLGTDTASESVVVPHPGNKGLYYLFSIGSQKLRYSLVDMSADSSRGDVVNGQKAVLLTPPNDLIERRVAAVQPCANGGYFVALRNFTNKQIWVYQVDSTGLNTTPLIRTDSSKYSLAAGQMKFSPDGAQLAVANPVWGEIEWYDMENGAVANRRSLDVSAFGEPLGLEFSPTGRFLYASFLPDTSTQPYRLVQFDLKEKNVLAALTSAFVLEPPVQTAFRAGALQLAPNGKIYAAGFPAPGQYDTLLHIIHFPDRPGAGCLFQENGLTLASGTGVATGLCNFPANYFYRPAFEFSPETPDTVCQLNAPIFFPTRTPVCRIDSFSVEAPGLSVTVIKGGGGLRLTFGAGGEGGLIITAHTACGSATDTVHVVVDTDLIVTQLQANVCRGAFFEYNGQQLGAGASESFVFQATNGCDSTVHVTVDAWPEVTVQLPGDTALVLGTSLQLTATVSGVEPLVYEWTPAIRLSCTNCPDPLATPEADMLYILQATDANGCIASDSIRIRVLADCVFFPATAFSPNGDGKNDWFYPKAAPCVRLVRSWAVYNRWGEQVFARAGFVPNEETLGWNGYLGSREAPAGVYVWMAELEYEDGRVERRRGEVLLLR